MSRRENIFRATVSAASLRASSSSSSSDEEISYGPLRPELTCLQRGNKRQLNKTWNCPRKTIKAVDSMGRIEERLNLMEPRKSTRKSNSPNKCKERLNARLKRYKRLTELAKPKSIASNEIDDSATSFKERKPATLNRHGLSKLDSERKSSATAKDQGNKTVLLKTKPVPNTIAVYRTSEHTEKLAEPRIRNEMEIRFPGKVVESALFATASKRLLELAKPKSCTMRFNLLQENMKTASAMKTASGVSREALKAICSPRILKLATPKNAKM